MQRGRHIGTTLCDSQITMDVMKDSYKMRWNIESHRGFAEIRTNIIPAKPRFKDFHSKSEDHARAKCACDCLERVRSKQPDTARNVKKRDKVTFFTTSFGRVTVLTRLLENDDWACEARPMPI